MVGPIRSSGVSSVSAVGRGSGGNDSRTGGALRKLAGRVASRLAREFKLVEDDRAGRGETGDDTDGYDDNRRHNQREAGDIYDIRGVARELTGDLNGRPTDEGRLARSLDGFVQESASLLAARPGAASLDTIARVIRANETPGSGETLDRSLRQIDQTTRSIAGGSAASRPPPSSAR